MTIVAEPTFGNASVVPEDEELMSSFHVFKKQDVLCNDRSFCRRVADAADNRVVLDIADNCTVV